MEKIKIDLECIDKSILKDAVYEINQTLFEKESDFELLFEPNMYQLRTTYAYEQFCYISNNDYGLKRIAFPIMGKKGVVIDGQGANLSCIGRLLPFYLSESEDITIRNFTIDYPRPFFSQGYVVRAEEGCVFLRIDKERYPYRIKDTVITFTGEDYESDYVNGLLEFSEEELRPSAQAVDIWINGRLTGEETGDGLLKLNHHSSKLPQAGTILTIKHEPRYIPGIFIDRCKHVTLENIHINHAGSMGVIAQFTENITINQLQICVDEASGNMVSANADALHFVGCSGKLLIENSRFEQQLDDILNVHGNYLKVHKIMDSTHVIAEIPHRQQLGAFGIKRGAELRICDDKTMRCKGVTYLEGYRTINNKYYLLEFSAPFLFEQGTGYCVEDGDAYPSVIFRNCTGGRNRARGLLLASAKDILIEGNQLDCEGAAVKICTDMDFWYESGRTTKVTICNNRIKRHNTGVWGKAIFDIDPQAKEFEPDFYINGEIIIRENIIESGEEPLIAVKSTAMLRVEDNIIISDTIRSDQELRINAQHMGVIQINNNSYKDKQRKEETYGQA